MKNMMKPNMLEVLKARAERAKNRQPLTPEEVRERVRNTPLFKMLKEAKEKKMMNELNKKEE